MVNGSPFAYEEGFVHRACELLRERGLNINPMLEAPIKTAQLDRIAAAIERGAPRAVVLQIGGLETLVLLEDVLRRRLGLAVPQRSYNNHLHTSPFDNLKAYARWRSIMTAKRVVDTLLGHPIVDFAEYRRNLRQTLELVRDRTRGPVLTLGLFPTVEPVSRYYRKRLEPMFAEETQRAGVAYFSATEAWQAAGRPSDIFHDPFHLNVRGHQWLAPPVANALHECLRGLTTPVRAHMQASGG